MCWFEQGEDRGAEERRREQMKITERDLRTQKEDNERKQMLEKHRGGETSTSTLTMS